MNLTGGFYVRRVCPFRHRPEEADSTEDMGILEAVRNRDWGRLGVLLGVYDVDLGKVVAAWSSLPSPLGQVIVTIVERG